ncbi:MAG: hypothetical protein JO228_06035, partial [Xanthobacteraceae bacterium]|nr:hypothetical protein [Xanthobacteraceae bacterium]
MTIAWAFMDETISASVDLSDPRLAAHAVSAMAVWLWSLDGSRLLWANPAGSAALGAPSPQALLARRYAIGDALRTHIERLAGSLAAEGGARLFRLRGFDGAGWTSLTCSCARLQFERTPGILVAATEPVGAELPLPERVRLLGFAEHDVIVAFAPNGLPLFATAAAERHLPGSATLVATGALATGALATTALATGHAQGMSRLGPVVLQRIGHAESTVLLARFSDPSEAETAQSTPIAPSEVKPMQAQPAQFEPDQVEPDQVEPTQAETARLEPAALDAARVAPHERNAGPERRRQPLRFVWQIDGAGRFFFHPEEFAELLGGAAQAMSGRPWSELNAEFAIDPHGQVARAIASRETWSNILVSWPVEGGRLEAELSGLPAFDRNRAFQGYRGFGVCRDVSHFERLTSFRRPPPSPDAHRFDERQAAPAIARMKEMAPEIARIAPNVVRFPGAAPFGEGHALEAEPNTLAEHGAFHELARQLTVRLQAAEHAPAPSADAADRVMIEEAQHDPADFAVPASPVDEPMSTEPILLEPMLSAPPGATSSTGLSGVASSGRLAPAVHAPARGAVASDDARTVPASDDAALLDRLPVGILIYRYEELLFANRTLFAWTDYPDLRALRAAGGLDALFHEAGAGALAVDGRRLRLATCGGDQVAVEARLFPIHWNGESAFATLFLKSAADERIRSLEEAAGDAGALARHFETLLERIEDTVLVIDRAGAILSAHGGGKTFLGSRPTVGASFEILFAPDARAGAAAQLAAALRDERTVSADRTVLGGNGELRPMRVTVAPLGLRPTAERM